MRIGLVGRGHVGLAVERLLAPAHELVTWDRTDGGELPTDRFADCDVTVVAVGTPQGDDGRLDTSGVRQVVEALPTQRLLLKSTVPPGTTDELARGFGRDICFWPEYIGQSRYHNPYFPEHIADVPFVVLGGPAATTTWALRLLQPVLGPTKTYYRCSAVEAELVKLTENAYFATKITFVNEIKRICDAAGADWDTVREGWLLDPRVERMHTLVFPDQPGFGGPCLPKDLNGLVAAARDAGYDPALLAQVLASNDDFRS